MPDTLAQKVRAKYPGAYDDMDDAALEAAVTAKYPGVYDDIPRTGTGHTNEPSRDEDPNTVGTFARHVGRQLNPIPLLQALPIPKAVGGRGVVAGPMGAVNSIVDAHANTAMRALDSYRSGNYEDAAVHALNALIPILGPGIDKAAMDLQKGHVASALGDAVGMGLATKAPAAAAKVVSKARVGLPENPNPAETAAVNFGRQRGIPVDAGTATGNRYVRGVQALADTSPLGGQVASRAKAAQATELARVGNEIADTVHPSSVTPEIAGREATTATQAVIDDLTKTADREYGRLRLIEGSSRTHTVSSSSKTVPTGLVNASGQPITRTVTTATQLKAPVDLVNAKKIIQPIYDRFKREAKLTPLVGAKARAFTAMDRLMNGPDAESVSVVDEALSDIKALAREDQGRAKVIVSALEPQVQKAVSQLGPTAQAALAKGRDAVKSRVLVQDVLDSLKNEPVQSYRQATAPKDAAIDHLRELHRVAPKVMPQIGRAWLDDALKTATSEGGFQHAAKLEADWRRLGPATKALLFPKGQAAVLDQFFLLAKRIAEQPNPSQTATVSNAGAQTALVFTHPTTGVPLVLGSAALSNVLHSPRAVAALQQGLRLYNTSAVTTSVSTRLAAFQAVANALRVGDSGVPALASSATPEEPSKE